MSLRAFSSALALVLFLPVGVAHAVLVTVVNHSFEADVTSDLASGAPTGWLNTIGGFGTQNGPTFNSRIAPTPDSDANNQFVFSNGGGYLEQGLSTNLAANQVYTLMVDIGDRNDTPFGGADLRLTTSSGTLTPTLSVTPTPANGDWATWTLTYTTTLSTPGLGQAIVIGLHSNGVQTLFDNVRLDAVIVGIPEASAFCLIAAPAGLGLVGYAIRKRRGASGG